MIDCQVPNIELTSATTSYVNHKTSSLFSSYQVHASSPQTHVAPWDMKQTRTVRRIAGSPDGRPPPGSSALERRFPRGV